MFSSTAAVRNGPMACRFHTGRLGAPAKAR